MRQLLCKNTLALLPFIRAVADGKSIWMRHPGKDWEVSNEVYPLNEDIEYSLTKPAPAPEKLKITLELDPHEARLLRALLNTTRSEELANIKRLDEGPCTAEVWKSFWCGSNSLASQLRDYADKHL